MSVAFAADNGSAVQLEIQEFKFQKLKTKHRLEIHVAVSAVGEETCERIRLAEERRTELANRRSEIDVVEDVARADAERQAVTGIGRRRAERTAGPAWAATTAAQPLGTKTAATRRRAALPTTGRRALHSPLRG